MATTDEVSLAHMIAIKREVQDFKAKVKSDPNGYQSAGEIILRCDQLKRLVDELESEYQERVSSGEVVRLI